MSDAVLSEHIESVSAAIESKASQSPTTSLAAGGMNQYGNNQCNG